MAEPITIILLTYERTEYAVRTVQSACQKLHYPELRWFIADDGSSQDHLDAVVRAIEESECGNAIVGLYSRRNSYGASANAGILAARDHGALTLFLEDDWELREHIDLWAYAALLMERENIGMVRMGYLQANLEGMLFDHQGQLYWELHDERTRHHSSLAFTGHPSLRHERFHHIHGLYPEGLQPGETEIAMAWNVKGAPTIVWPAELRAAGPWAHIGTEQSYVWNGGVPL